MEQSVQLAILFNRRITALARTTAFRRRTFATHRQRDLRLSKIG